MKTRIEISGEKKLVGMSCAATEVTLQEGATTKRSDLATKGVNHPKVLW